MPQNLSTRPAFIKTSFLQNFPLIEKRGDLFTESGLQRLAHCISADCKLGAGIAKTFVAKFGPASFRQRIAATRPTLGTVTVLVTECGKVIYNLVTKEKYWQKPTLAAVVECLIAMRNDAVTHGVKRIGMPRIGCGLDQLKWEDVRAAIEHVFANTGVQIVVVDFGAAPTAERRAETFSAPREVAGTVPAKRLRVDEPVTSDAK